MQLPQHQQLNDIIAKAYSYILGMQMMSHTALLHKI